MLGRSRWTNKVIFSISSETFSHRCSASFMHGLYARSSFRGFRRIFCRSLTALRIATGVPYVQRKRLMTFGKQRTSPKCTPLRINGRCLSARPFSTLGKISEVWALETPRVAASSTDLVRKSKPIIDSSALNFVLSNGA